MAKAKKQQQRIRDRITGFRRVAASSLVENPMNWRSHPQAQLNALEGVLEEVGFAGAELCRELPDGRLMMIDGHARASLVGDMLVPCLITDLTEQEAEKLLRVFDPIAAMATTDNAKLDALDSMVVFTNAALMAMVDNAKSSRHILQEMEDANQMNGDTQRVGEVPETYATEQAERTQTLFPLSIVVDRTTKERWDFYKESQGVTKDSAGFAKLMESIP